MNLDKEIGVVKSTVGDEFNKDKPVVIEFAKKYWWIGVIALALVVLGVVVF